MSESATPLSVSTAAAKAGSKKRSRPLTSSFVLKLNDVMRLRRWDELSSDPSISKWLVTTAAAKEVFMTSERTTCKVCLTTKQFVHQDERLAPSLHFQHAQGQQGEGFAGGIEKEQGLAALHVIVVPQDVRSYDVITTMVI